MKRPEQVTYLFYQKIVNANRKLFLALVFGGLIFSVLVSVYSCINIPQDTLYWVLSSIAQSLIALVALIGVLVIFRFEITCNSKKKNREKFLEMKRYAYQAMLEFTIYTFFVVALSLFFLSITHLIYDNFALPILYIVLLLTIYSFFLVIKMIPEALFGDYKKRT